MSEKNTRVVRIGEEAKSYPADITFREIVEEHRKESEPDILLVKQDGCLRELGGKLKKDCALQFVTVKDTIGYETYRRTAILLLLKAIFDVGGKKSIDKAVIHYAIGNGLYFTLEGQENAQDQNLEIREKISEEFITSVKNRMLEMIAADIPIIKRSVRTDDAISLFHRHHMYDKENCFITAEAPV